jgi:hypothetical protein
MPTTKSFLSMLVGAFLALFAILLFFTLGDNRAQAMNAMVEADAALIAFLAVVSTFKLTILREDSKDAKKDYLAVKEKVDAAFKKSSSGYLTEGEYQKYAQDMRASGFRQGWSDGSIDNAINLSIKGVIFFVFSILGALATMTNNFFVQYVGLFFTLGGFVFGVMYLIFILNKSSVPSKEELRLKVKMLMMVF